MKYRAYVDGVVADGKPLQAMGNCIGKMREWAQQMADMHNANVLIYENQEKLADTIVPANKPA